MTANWQAACSLKILQQRAFLLAKIRQYFSVQNVLEVETPILSSAGNTDINIDSFTAESINSEFSKSYLRTSPEFPLKRLLCSGVGDIFEIGKVFRRGETSKSHNIEFTMLEWYRIDFDYMQLIQDISKLFESILLAFDKKFKQTEVISFSNCFKQYLGLNINVLTELQLNKACNDNGYSGSKLDKDACLDYLFATQIQPQFDKDCLTFVTLYPASQAALAQINPHDNSTSLRFEVFYQGIELGNGYQELTDAQELLLRFENDNNKRSKSKQVQIDNNLLAAMNNGMPNCAGIAVGIDRLLMVLLGIDSISPVISFNASNS